MKRLRDVGNTTTSKRSMTRSQGQDSQTAITQMQEISKISSEKLEDNEYIAELQAEAYIAHYFKIGVPNYAQLCQEVYQEAIKRGLPRIHPKSVLKHLLWPHLVALHNEGFGDLARHKSQLLFGIWELKDEWTYPIDNDFAANFAREVARSGSDSPSSRLCGRCSKIDLNETFASSNSTKIKEYCSLCQFLSQCRTKSTETSTLLLIDRRSSVRVCASSGSERATPDLQIGFPDLPESEVRSKLLLGWLQLCDQTHQEIGCPLEGAPLLPTRVLDVESGNVRLHIAEPGDRGHYLALSHCWGNLTEGEKRIFCTSTDNIDNQSHVQGFDMSILPKTFQDAIMVTRLLGKRYLWIDSVCIIQYGDNLEDWKTESKRMASVFNNSYCTIAATSAKNPTGGFLDRMASKQPEPQYVKVHTPMHGPIYISKVIDDYHSDVEHGILNKRAWVLQERVLSRRIIHFTENQTYWECGDGVRCETLTRMRNSKALFLSDPTFPALLKHRRERDQIQLFQDLFSRYSRLGLTKFSDRPVAVAGLVERLAETFSMKATHGVYDGYLHRSLIWHRSESQEMQRIAFATDRKVPSWSWMAYTGKINYMDIPYYKVEWSQSIRLTDCILETQVRPLQPCRIDYEDGEMYLKQRLRSRGKGWVKFDGCGVVDLQTLRCVIIGRDCEPGNQQRYHVMFVTPESSGGDHTFDRVGVGSIPAAFISFQDGAVSAHVV